MHFNQKLTHLKFKFFICISLITCSNTSFSAHIDTTKAIQSFPTKSIRLIVPQAPGGSNDIMARYFGGLLSERISRQVVVDNRASAEGMIATELVTKSVSDDYTILMTSTEFAMNPAVVKKLHYDPMKD
jgi:tripartite-type tricarboxylate transporter receptor subunit TctC